MPLDPKRLLYTRVGQKRLPKGTVLDVGRARLFVKIITEHAFRHIFSPEEDPRIPRLRSRYVNADAYQSEKAEWSRWAQEQLAADFDLVRPLPGG